MKATSSKSAGSSDEDKPVIWEAVPSVFSLSLLIFLTSSSNESSPPNKSGSSSSCLPSKIRWYLWMSRFTLMKVVMRKVEGQRVSLDRSMRVFPLEFHRLFPLLRPHIWIRRVWYRWVLRRHTERGRTLTSPFTSNYVGRSLQLSGVHPLFSPLFRRHSGMYP